MYDEYEDIFDYPEEDDYLEFPVREADIPLLAIWEFLGYLDISIDCFTMAMENQRKEYDLIYFQIGNYAKIRVEKFSGDNIYTHADEIAVSYHIFNKYVFRDVNILYKLSLEGEMEKHRQKEREKIFWGTPSMIIEDNYLCGGTYLIDTYPHIVAKKHKRFLDIFTDREVFKSLYERAKNEIETKKDEVSDYRKLFISKMDILEAKLDSFSDQLMASLPSPELTQNSITPGRHKRCRLTCFLPRLAKYP